MSAPLLVRAARVEDDRAIVETMRASWTVAYEGLVPDALSDSLTHEVRLAKRRKRRAEADPERREWVAVRDEGGTQAVLGYLSSGPEREPEEAAAAGHGTGRVAEVYSLYVRPDSQGRGIGGRLLGHALDDLAARGYEAVRLWVLTGNGDARRFYARHGFEVELERRAKHLLGHELDHARLVRPLA